MTLVHCEHIREYLAPGHRLPCAQPGCPESTPGIGLLAPSRLCSNGPYVLLRFDRVPSIDAGMYNWRLAGVRGR